jgi:hypothetical protein
MSCIDLSFISCRDWWSVGCSGFPVRCTQFQSNSSRCSLLQYLIKLQRLHMLSHSYNNFNAHWPATFPLVVFFWWLIGVCIIMLLLHFNLQTGLIHWVRKPVCSTRHVSANVQASCWGLGQHRITKFPRTWNLQSKNPLCLYFCTETSMRTHTCQSHLLYRQQEKFVNHSMEKKRNV